MVWDVLPTTFMKKVVKDHKKVAVQTAMKLDRALVNITPKDTGYSANNWMPGITEPDLTVTDDKNPIERAKEKFRIDDIPDFGNLYLSNSVDYLKYVNYGVPEGVQHSQKAPLMFFELTVDEFR